MTIQKSRIALLTAGAVGLHCACAGDARPNREQKLLD